MKKILALLLAMMMLVAMAMPAMAAEGAPADTSISVSGLSNGDTVNFYQVLKFDETATTTGGWVNATGFTLTDTEIQKILSLGADGKPVTITDDNKDDYGIDAGLAARIATMTQNAIARFVNVAASEGTATQSTTAVGDAGLYVALVTPGTADTLYNPVFVGADYTEGITNAQEAVTGLSYNPAALAKKETITLTKEVTGANNGTGTVSDTTGANTKYDVDVGDDVVFTITSKVPAYSATYQNPTYQITDTMEDGLVLKAVPTVTIEGITLDAADYNVDPSAIGETDVTSFTITLTSTGLGKVAATGTAKTITVNYTATVKSLENATVSEKDNEATVKFSNNPEDSTSYSLLEDKTRNYTFTIDGNLLGYTGTSYETDELIKTSLNPDGTPAYTTKKYRSGTVWTELSPLEGAQFAIYKQEPADADYASVDAAKASEKIYTNTVETDGIVGSDSNGRLKIAGLDAGEYWLREVSAPTGYIADNRTFHITIAATYDTIPGGTYQKNVGTEDEPKMVTVKYDAYDVLKGYTVTVNDGKNDTTSTYSIENKGQAENKKVDKATYQEITGEHFAGDNVTPISNTKGIELPSTGGMGTTILYVGGSILVLLAVILLVTKRRMNANDD